MKIKGLPFRAVPVLAAGLNESPRYTRSRRQKRRLRRQHSDDDERTGPVRSLHFDDFDEHSSQLQLAASLLPTTTLSFSARTLQNSAFLVHVDSPGTRPFSALPDPDSLRHTSTVADPSLARVRLSSTSHTRCSCALLFASRLLTTPALLSRAGTRREIAPRFRRASIHFRGDRVHTVALVVMWMAW